jgi:hypothetical protein
MVPLQPIFSRMGSAAEILNLEKLAPVAPLQSGLFH